MGPLICQRGVHYRGPFAGNTPPEYGTESPAWLGSAKDRTAPRVCDSVSSWTVTIRRGGKVVTADDSPTLEDILNALNDQSCRAILRCTDEPKTANQLARVCDLSASTVYRKLDLLSSASLLKETDTLLPGGGKRTQYERDVENLQISFEAEDTIAVEIDRPRRSSDERLVDIWSKMGEEL